MSNVIAFIADGSEEVECLAVIDILKRGGVNVTLASVDGLQVTTSHGARITADCLAQDADYENADLLFLPGGMPGTKHLASSNVVATELLKANKLGKRIAAICAAPSVLGMLSLLQGKKATCFPGFEQFLTGATFTGAGVTTDGLITTAKGLGKAIDLGLELLRLLKGADVANKVKSAIQY